MCVGGDWRGAYVYSAHASTHLQPARICPFRPSCVVQGIADMLLDEHQTAQVARPGTSMARPHGTSSVRLDGGMILLIEFGLYNN